MQDCENWLSEYLAGNIFKNSRDVKTEAEKRGFTKGQLTKARKVLGVLTVSDAVQHNGTAANWYWLIPKENEGV